MAAPDPRTRDQPDIRARISIHDESPHYIRQRLQISDQTRRLPRSQQSWHPPETSELVHHAVLGKNNAPPHPYRPGRGSDGHSLDPAWPSDRSNSLDSLSTLQRGAEAASLSMYRGSPISSIRHPYFSPTLSSLAGHHTQDPCPPRQQLRVETLSAQRKYHKALKKSLKRDQKEQRRAQKVEAQLRRASLAAEVAAAREKDVAGWGDSLPLRSRSTRAIASQIKKTLSFKGPLSKLSRGRRQASVPPTLDDFDSKQEIHDYLNPNPATPFVDIAELPAELPQYTPFENSTRTQDNEPLTLSDGNPLAKEKANGSLSDQPNARQETSQTPPRSMRCDACQSPIRLNQIYYHCSICENGDRILCSSCNQAGWSCRHMITEKVRDVTRAAPSQARGATVPKGGASRHDADHYVTSMAVLPGLDHSTESGHCTESSVQFRMSKIMPRACHNVAERKKLSLTSLETLANGYVEKYQARETELRRLERDLVLREKEIALLERGASIRERKAALREQEAALTIKKQLVTIQLQSAMVGRTGEAWTGIGSQFQDLADEDEYIRAHGTKRKAGDNNSASFWVNGTASDQQTPLQWSPGGGRDSKDENDEKAAGTPKKIKQTANPLSTAGKLFACPYCKFDRPRYSEHNRHEKHYRGCSTKYLTDISRLKQHLYRVHWRGIHCCRCFAKFRSKDLLQAHMRAEPCSVIDCPCPEKFDEAQYNEIRRKRPTNSAEQVWYTIYGILFPGHPLPDSPYADNVDTPPQSATSSAGAECQDLMDALSATFESRLDQQAAVPGQDWLRSLERREVLRQQLRLSISDVLERLNTANSFAVTSSFVETSPYSTVPPTSACEDSISSTPVSSVPASPVNGNSRRGMEPNSHFLLPDRGQSYSRPITTRTSQRSAALEQAPAPQMQQSPGQVSSDIGEGTKGVTFSVTSNIDPENDQYDDECNSWSLGDDVGLALSTDFDFEFDSRAPSAIDEVPLRSSAPQPRMPTHEFTPVKLSSLSDDPGLQNSTAASELKPNHSTASSIDSGYGSLGRGPPPSSEAGTGAPKLKRTRPKRETMKGTETSTPKESSPVPEADINFDALDLSFLEFSGGVWSEESGNVAGQSL